jgi:Helix-turn-helix
VSDRSTVQDELRALYQIRALIDERIAFFETQLVVRNVVQKRSNGSLYPGVNTEDLKPYIQEWVDQGYTLRTLADKAMISETTLQKIMRGSVQMTRDDTADRILTALGLPNVYNELVPDPPEGQYYEE